MIARPMIGSVAAAFLAGCLPAGTAPGPRPLKPEGGPRGSVHVEYVGGAYTRQIQARFRVDQAAYVLIGHLGGDGQLRVLYPETPKASGWVSAGKTVSLKPYAAIYDRSPHLFSFATAPHRSLGAEMDSYDGLGHGYVFMIASHYPIDFDALRGEGDFDELEIEDYDRLRDPRYSVRAFADDIVTGPYTLKFASSLGGGNYARATGCLSRWGLMSYRVYDDLSRLGYAYPYFMYPGSSLLGGFAFARYGYDQRSCRGTYYAIVPAYHQRIRSGPITTVPTGAPPEPLTPRLQRPERGAFTHPARRGIDGQSEIQRGTVTSSRRSFDGGGWRNSPNRTNATRERSDFIARPGRGVQGSSERHEAPSRASRPADAGRVTNPSAPSRGTTSTSSSGGETRAEKPRDQQ